MQDTLAAALVAGSRGAHVRSGSEVSVEVRVENTGNRSGAEALAGM